MINRRQVLLVDGLSETAEVLKAVLEPRGLEVNRIRAQQGEANPGTESQPDVVVLHEESSDNTTTDDGRWKNVPKVVIGKMRLPDDVSLSTASKDSSENAARELPPCFQYGELVNMIEALLQKH